MERITKELCFVCLKRYYQGELLRVAFFFVFWSLFAKTFVEKTEIFVIVVVLLFLYFAFRGVKLFKKMKNMNSANFYVVEDTVVEFKKRLRLRGRNPGTNYIYLFRDHGKHVIGTLFLTHEIDLFPTKHIKWWEIRDLNIQAREKGDLFYLLILEENGKKTIVESFYQCYFCLNKSDFEPVDGKYYCKAELH